MSLDDWFEQVRRREGASTRRTSSALSPLIWLCGVVVVPCVAGAVHTDSTALRWVLICIAIVCVAAVLAAYFYLLAKDRDRLHSEHHLVQMRALDVIAEKGGNVVMLSSSVEMSSNPEPLSDKMLGPKA